MEKQNLRFRQEPKVEQFFVLKGKGVPHLRGWGRGNQFVNVVIHTPEKVVQKTERNF